MLGVKEDDLRVILAIHQVVGEAGKWWAYDEPKCAEVEQDWKGFTKVFLEEYFPSVVKWTKINEFLSLVQGSSTVAEYAARFRELACYASSILGDNGLKARHFERGLHPLIRLSITPLTSHL